MTPTSSPMPTRRDTILDAATRLFAERGYEGASMADLAESVGLRKASLFHHFASKDALYTAVFERLVEMLSGVVMAEAATEGSHVARLDRMTDAVVQVFGAHASAARLWLREMMDWGPYARTKFRETILPVLQAAEGFVRDGQKEGVFVADVEPKQLILSAVGMFVVPFTIGNVVEQWSGTQPFDPVFVEARKAELRGQIHRLILRPSAAS